MATFQELPSTTDDVLLENLSTADIIRFGRTSTSARQISQSYINRRYRLSRLLSRFFLEHQTEELRTLMSGTGMVISGSIALQFLDRTIYPDSDLDLYAPFKFAWRISEWLLSAGYTYTPRNGSLLTVNAALHKVAASHSDIHTGNTPATHRGYLKATCVLDFKATDPPRKIQLITTLRSTFELILGFHSTCVRNLITHDRAYCLFPQATLEERRALTYLDPFSTHEADQIAYHKYIARGWRLVDGITRNEFDNPYSSFARGTRFVGDNKCWTLPILPLREDLPPSNVAINSFALEYDENLQPQFSFRHLDLDGLQQPYVLLEDDMDYIMALPRVYRGTHADSGPGWNEEEQEKGYSDDDEEVYADKPEDGNNDTLDHALKFLVAGIREIENRM